MYSYNHLRSKFDGRNILVDVLQECCGTPAEQAQKRKEFADVSQNPKEVAGWARNRKRYTYVARKQKRRAARWDRHGRAQKSSERNRKRKKEKSDEAIKKIGTGKKRIREGGPEIRRR